MAKIYAVKGNREETITEAEKENFLAAGYDIIENGKRIHSPSKTVSYNEYKAVYDQVDKLKTENKNLKAKVKELESKVKEGA